MNCTKRESARPVNKCLNKKIQSEIFRADHVNAIPRIIYKNRRPEQVMH